MVPGSRRSSSLQRTTPSFRDACKNPSGSEMLFLGDSSTPRVISHVTVCSAEFMAAAAAKKLLIPPKSQRARDGESNAPEEAGVVFYGALGTVALENSPFSLDLPPQPPHPPLFPPLFFAWGFTLRQQPSRESPLPLPPLLPLLFPPVVADDDDSIYEIQEVRFLPPVRFGRLSNAFSLCTHEPAAPPPAGCLSMTSFRRQEAGEWEKIDPRPLRARTSHRVSAPPSGARAPALPVGNLLSEAEIFPRREIRRLAMRTSDPGLAGERGACTRSYLHVSAREEAGLVSLLRPLKKSVRTQNVVVPRLKWSDGLNSK